MSEDVPDPAPPDPDLAGPASEDTDPAGGEVAASPPADGTSPADDVADLGYEAARDELVEVVRSLEGGGVTLEESLALWERGEALAGRCQLLLDGARARLDAARGDGDGGTD